MSRYQDVATWHNGFGNNPEQLFAAEWRALFQANWPSMLKWSLAQLAMDMSVRRG